MNHHKNWNHHWFGVWKESGPAYASCPSIQDFICDNGSVTDKEKIVQYLATAQIVSTTSRRSFPCVITGKKFSGSLSYRTDGVWLWPDDLAYYVREHNVCLPDEMLATMNRNNYLPPPVDAEAVRKLERPAIG